MALLSGSPATNARSGFPFLDLKTEYAEMRDEVMSAVERVLESQHFILGPEVERFESEIADRVGTKFAVGCASGSDALLLSLLALGIEPGDEVITTPFTFVATLGAIVRLGAKPVLVDIDSRDFNIDTGLITQAISKRTRAILPVHLFGLAVNLGSLMQIADQHNLAVIEDAAQALGATYQGKSVGSWGKLGCFSFFPSKNLGGAGDGGMVTTDDATLADRLRVLRVHGSRSKYKYECLGINSRLDALQAAILSVKLQYLAKWTKLRQRNAQRYGSLFDAFGLGSVIQLPALFPDREHVFNQYVIVAPRRDELRQFLKERGIPTEIYYPHPLHLEPAFAHLGYGLREFPNSEKLSKSVLALPVSPTITEDQQQYVVESIKVFVET